MSKCFRIVLLMEGSALVKLCNVDNDDNDYILFVYTALSLPKCFPLLLLSCLLGLGGT